MPKKGKRDEELEDRKEERKASRKAPAAAAAVTEGSDEEEDKRKKKPTKEEESGDEGEAEAEAEATKGKGAKKGGKKDKKGKGKAEDDGDKPTAEKKRPLTKAEKRKAEEEKLKAAEAEKTKARGAGVMLPGDSAEVKSVSAGASATQNACIIVSAGGGSAGGKRHKWPEYVFLKGSGFNTKGKSKANARDVKIEDFSLQVPGKILVTNATLTLAFGSKYGLHGRNGIGKSVLLRAISERDPATAFGRVPANIRILHVQQEVTGDDRTPLDTVLSADIERTWLLQEVDRLTKIEQQQHEASEARAKAREEKRKNKGAEDEDEDDDDDDHDYDEDDDDDEAEEEYSIVDLYERLREIDAHKAVPRACSILIGLGFLEEDIRTKPTRSYSGGWRMRIALAQALFLQPELLILDEPTNHLDLLAVIWLESYLSKWKKTLLLVSHDASFLSAACDHIVHFYNHTLTTYKGDYFAFLKARGQKQAQLARQLDKQTRKKDKLDEMKNKGGNSGRAAQIKSRTKQFEKEEKVAEEREEMIPEISFPDPGPLGLPVLQFQEVDFGYEESKLLFRNLDFGLYMDSRVGLVGPNGCGKTTLMKLISGDLKETRGYVHRNPHLKLARFHQHHVDQLNMDQTPIEYMQARFGDAQVQDIRQFLGRFGVKGGMALQKIATLSGGQRSRLVFAELCWKSPHILLLDEPTNHLDMDTIESLIDGLREFKGGVILISHHQRLIEAACKEVWVVQKAGVQRFEGGFEEYKRMIIDSLPPEDDD